MAMRADIRRTGTIIQGTARIGLAMSAERYTASSSVGMTDVGLFIGQKGDDGEDVKAGENASSFVLAHLTRALRFTFPTIFR